MSIVFKVEHRLRTFYWITVSPFSRALLRICGVSLEGTSRLIGLPIISKASNSRIFLGHNITINSVSRGTSLGVSKRTIIRTLSPGAEVSIGSDTGLTGTIICCAIRVSIGKRCLIGSDAMIVDTDFHPVKPISRRYLPRPTSDPDHQVIIEDDVFVGARSIILKGVRIGHGSVIGAGSVVTGDVAPMSVYAGNPAKFIRHI